MVGSQQISPTQLFVSEKQSWYCSIIVNDVDFILGDSSRSFICSSAIVTLFNRLAASAFSTILIQSKFEFFFFDPTHRWTYSKRNLFAQEGNNFKCL
jgi:hypothetical protein